MSVEWKSEGVRYERGVEERRRETCAWSGGAKA